MSSYNLINQITAILLLLAFLIPTGLHAKQLTDFCMMDRNANEMIADDNCCKSEAEERQKQTEYHYHNDCEHGFICACNISESVLSDAEWIVSSTGSAIEISVNEYLGPFITTSERVSISQNKQLAQHNPPLWLVYDTLLN